MAQIVTITNPLTGQPAQVDQLDHTAQEIDDVIYQVLGGGGIGSEKLLALAAAVPYSTSQTYALGAYCTRAGKLYRCTTAITTAETWTADHWTETTIGAELVSIYANLKNHASQHASDGSDPITPESIGAYSKTEIDTLLSEKPTAYYLPVLDGYSNLNLIYFKTKEGVVNLHGTVGIESGSFSTWTAFAVIPEGFRPDENIDIPAVVSAGTNKGSAVVLYYNNASDAKDLVTTSPVPAGTTRISFSITYLARG